MINKNIFIEQTTYYIYRCEEDRQEGRAFLVTSDKEIFDFYKERTRRGEGKNKVNRIL